MSNNAKALSSSKQNFSMYLKNFKAEKGDFHTHTRIGSKELNVFGGIYNIEYTDEFWYNYYKHVIENNNDEFLTEKQIDDGPLLVDIDMRYNLSIKSRQHSKNHIIDIIDLYLKNLLRIFKIYNNSKIDVYVFEKSKVNILEDKVKDGIHLIFTIKMLKSEQCYLRRLIIDEINNIWSDMPFTNNTNDLFDEGITKGICNWQMYGCKKPGNEKYELSYHYSCVYNMDDDLWNYTNNNIKNIDILALLPIISARNNNHIRFQINDDKNIIENIEKEKKMLNSLNKEKINSNNNINTNKNSIFYYFNNNFDNIKTQSDLDNCLQIIFDSDKHYDYELKEIYNFTMILPESFYGEGSFSKWIRVGWALKNNNCEDSNVMFIIWMKFSSQYDKFNFKDIQEYYNLWNSFQENNPDGLTKRSIMYWAKNEEKYQDVRRETISYYIEKTLETMVQKDKVTEFDLAIVLYQMFKDEFVCVSIKNNLWYQYKNYKWHEIDSGNTLRLYISKTMHQKYLTLAQQLMEKITNIESKEENAEPLKIKSAKIGDICLFLKTTSWKNNIMKEAKELFYDKDFINKVDANPYLLGFNNYVVDFKNKIYRKGKPEDFITKSTNIDYIPYEDLSGNTIFNTPNCENHEKVIEEINNFMCQLFPNEELRRYMWEHLASVLIGTNDNQTFNIYTGSGSNGKSKLVELLGKALGDYKATVPITLITQTRNSIGSTSPEIVQLMGVRYAVMQEPSKNEKINEGIMKEITGGDPIQGRALFKDTVTFIPQFKLVVCTNVLFDIKSNDDGTWRRIRICDFMSKFTENPYNNSKFPNDNFPYQFDIDKKIDEKFEVWAPVLMSMLVKLAFETNGNVKDAKIVTEISDKYREGQDYISEFVKDKIIRKQNSKIRKTDLIEEFKKWYINNHGKTYLPNNKEIVDYMDKYYGKAQRGKWLNVELCDEYSSDEDDE